MSKRDSIFQDDIVFIVLDTFDDAPKRLQPSSSILSASRATA